MSCRVNRDVYKVTEGGRRGIFYLRNSLLQALGYTKERILKNQYAFEYAVQQKNIVLLMDWCSRIQGKAWDKGKLVSIIDCLNEIVIMCAINEDGIYLNELKSSREVIRDLMDLNVLNIQGGKIHIKEFIEVEVC